MEELYDIRDGQSLNMNKGPKDEQETLAHTQHRPDRQRVFEVYPSRGLHADADVHLMSAIERQGDIR